MKYFLFSLAFMGVAIIGMAVGVILSNKSLKGSCGGLGKLMGDDCEFCDNKDECEKDKEEPALEIKNNVVQLRTGL